MSVGCSLIEVVLRTKGLDDLCRVCGGKLHRGIKAKGTAVEPEPPYSCISYDDKFLVAFNVNILVDTPEIHPQMFCTFCLTKLTCSCGKRAEESLQVLCSATHALVRYANGFF